jgi:hypothetical protein
MILATGCVPSIGLPTIGRVGSRSRARAFNRRFLFRRRAVPEWPLSPRAEMYWRGGWHVIPDLRYLRIGFSSLPTTNFERIADAHIASGTLMYGGCDDRR